MPASPIIDGNEILTVGEVAGVLRCSKLKVYQLIESKQIIAFRFGEGGSTWRIARQNLNDFIQNRINHEQQRDTLAS